MIEKTVQDLLLLAQDMLYHGELAAAIRQNMVKSFFDVVIDGIAFGIPYVGFDLRQERDNLALKKIERWRDFGLVVDSHFLAEGMYEVSHDQSHLQVGICLFHQRHTCRETQFCTLPDKMAQIA
jgi:hypothetical protein